MFEISCPKSFPQQFSFVTLNRLTYKFLSILHVFGRDSHKILWKEIINPINQFWDFDHSNLKKKLEKFSNFEDSLGKNWSLGTVYQSLSKSSHVVPG